MHQEETAGSVLREARRAQQLSMRDLARLAGVEHSTVSRVERGEVQPTVVVARKLTAALGLSLAQLWSGDAA